jgi:hypothetical protein
VTARPCRTDLRLSESEKARLQVAAERLGVTEAEAARLAIDRLCVQTLDDPKRNDRLTKRQGKVD